MVNSKIDEYMFFGEDIEKVKEWVIEYNKKIGAPTQEEYNQILKSKIREEKKKDKGNKKNKER